VGPHQGGQVSAPVFHRVAQQVLEYLHVPHDLPLSPKHQLLLAQSKLNDKDLEEGTPDHPGEPLETADASNSPAPKPSGAPSFSPPNTERGTNVVQAAVRETLPNESSAVAPKQARPVELLPSTSPAEPKLPSSGTVVLDVEQGGIEVPSFAGKTVRKALEAAQDAGLELEVVGSGVARQQTPVAGTHVPQGSSVTVQFGP
jgi:cell division protein FtsI (penicillin-binding protein 3)